MKKIIYVVSFVSSIIVCADVAVENDVNVLKEYSDTALAPAVVVEEEEFITQDKIVAMVLSDDSQILITKSELDRPNLDSSPRTLEDILFEHLICLDVKPYGILPTDEKAEPIIKRLQHDNGKTEQELKQIFENSGYSYQEARMQLARLAVVDEALTMRVRSGLIIDGEEVVAYYNAHPEQQGALLERALVAYDDNNDRQKQLVLLKKRIRNGDAFEELAWSSPFAVTRNELAQGMQTIIDLEVGQIWQPRTDEMGFELFRVKEKDPLVVAVAEEINEKKRAMINMQLQAELFEKKFTEYKDKLFNEATIIYKDDTYQP